jgi:hypothetical protein
MGTSVDVFKCHTARGDHEHSRAELHGRGRAPGPVMSVVIVLSCSSRERAIGAYLMAPID